MRRIVVVIGMHRSGTSLAARALAGVGLPFGGPLLIDPVPDNADGYFEHAEVVACHEALLDAYGRPWHGPDGALPLPAGREHWPDTRAAEDALAAVAERELAAGGGLWGVKDPRLTRFLPLWRRVAGRVGADLVPLLCVRSPAAVAASLAARDGHEPAFAVALWRAHMLDALAEAGPDLVTLDYDRLIEAPEPTLGRAAAGLGLPVDTERLAAAAATVRPDLRHHRPDEGLDPGAEARLLHRCLAAWAEGGRDRLAEAGLLAPGTARATAANPEAASPTVSIVMRTRNRTALIGRALRSMLGQMRGDWELIVVNDGGAAGPLDTALAPWRAALGDRLRLHDWPIPLGLEAASNFAIRRSRGRFVAIHDDDDTWRPGFLAATIAHLEATGAAGVVTRSTVVAEHFEGGRPVRDGETPFGPDLPAIVHADLTQRNRFPPIAFLYRRSAWDEVGPYRADLPVLGDWEFNLRFVKRHVVPVLPEPLARWHRRPPDDRHPNTAARDHERIAAQLVREGVIATPGQAPPGAGTGAAGGLVWAAGLPDAAVPTRRIARLMPTHTEAVTADERGTVSTGIDPQVHFTLPEPIAPGPFAIAFDLDVEGRNGSCDLFFTDHRPFSAERQVVIPVPPGGRCRAVIDSGLSVRRLRIDPMSFPGRFRLGAVTVETGLRIEPVRAGTIARSGRARLPDFLILGAQRSGTTWLAQALGAVPGLWLPPCKELHYFDQVHGVEAETWPGFRRAFLDGERAAAPPDRLAWALRFAAGGPIDDVWYADLFAEAPDGARLGEATPAYALLPEAGVAHVARIMPDVRLLLLIRDPVERAWSGAIHAARHERPDAPVDEADVRRHLATAGVERRSRYVDTLARWEAVFGAGAVRVLFFDDIAIDPDRVLAEALAAIGGPQPPGPAPRERVNAGPALPMPDDVAARLGALYRDDLVRLAARFGGPAEAWLARAAGGRRSGP